MINIQGMDFAYHNQRKLFNNLSLQLNPGTITGLLGKNGAGKTTLLKLTTGLLFPSAGIVQVAGFQPAQRNPSFLSDVFFVAEEFYMPAITINKFIRASHPFYKRFDQALMDNLLIEFDLSGDESIAKLSYGQKKKFLISFALATRCRLLILDEPTNGLDIPSKAIFRKVMAGHLDDDQLVLISTHQVKDVENLIDNIVMLADGKVILKRDLLEISSQLLFEKTQTPDAEEVLYSEPSPGGYKVIKPQTNGSSSVDIELLFNAISKGTKLFRNE